MVLFGLSSIGHAKPPGTKANDLGLGLQTFSSFGGADVALSAWIELGQKSILQPVLAMGSTSPFQAAVGGFYRHIMSGNQLSGLHVGAGTGFGTIAGTPDNDFVFFLGGLVGTHFQLRDMDNLLFSLDAAAIFQTVDGQSDFRMGGLSPALGLAVHYML